eukprot:1331652-Pyramimonas_sp.AAC.1
MMPTITKPISALWASIMRAPNGSLRPLSLASLSSAHSLRKNSAGTAGPHELCRSSRNPFPRGL